MLKNSIGLVRCGEGTKMRTQQFTLAFLQATAYLPEEIQKLIFNNTEPTPPTTPPQTPRKPLRNLDNEYNIKPRNLFF